MKKLIKWAPFLIVPVIGLMIILFNTGSVPEWLFGVIIAGFVLLVFGPMILSVIKDFAGMGESARILKTGREASAVIQGVGESSKGNVTINSQPVLRFELEVHDGNKPPYNVVMETLVPRVALGMIKPGANIAIKIDQADTKKVAINWSGKASKPVYGRSGDWTEEDEKNAIVGTAKMLSCEDTGRSENFKTIIKFSYIVQPHGGESYQLNKEMGLPANVIQKIKGAVGKIVPAKIHPRDKNKVTLSFE